MSRNLDIRRDAEDSNVFILIINCCNMNSSGSVFVETRRSRVFVDVIIVSIVFVPCLIPLVVRIYIVLCVGRTNLGV